MLIEHELCGQRASPPHRGRTVALSGVVAAAARAMFFGTNRFPRRLMWHSASWVAAFTRRTARLVVSPNSQIRWREVANKIEAYTMFASGARLLGERLDPCSLAAAAESLRQEDRYRAVWAMEGASYYYALRGGRLNTREIRELRPAMWVPLHTGAGLVWAEAALRSARASGLERMLGAHWERCRREALDGYHEMVFEAMGLVAATLYPQLVPEIGRHTAGSEDQSALFWHGVGRGLYFQPATFLPVRAAQNWPARLAQCRHRGESASANLIAGLAWAMTLVNLRDPELVRKWLAEHGTKPSWHKPLQNGMNSALIVWKVASPGDPAVEQLRRFERSAGDLRDGNLPAEMFRLRALPE